jgi:hypothetical protein
MKMRIPVPLLRRLPFSLYRSSTAIDADGLSTGTRTLVLQGRGTDGPVNDAEQLLALQRGTKIEKELAVELGVDIQAGDYVTITYPSGGQSYEVVKAADRRSYRAAQLRRETD